MKRTISLLLMSLMGMVGTYAWAGSNREDTVDRLQKSVDEFSQSAPYWAGWIPCTWLTLSSVDVFKTRRRGVMRCFWSLLTSPEGFIFLLIGERQARLTAFKSSNNRSKHAPSPCPS